MTDLSQQSPAPPGFQVFAKPGGALCNLDCRYCYYLEKTALYPRSGPARMEESLLEAYIVQHLQAAAGGEVRFSWHGGEPTLLGVDYFRTIVTLQKKHAPPDVRLFNAL
ncbi:MAG: anaerobic sulfatase maturase, partial [Gemmatimonadota bacterium]